MRRDYGLWSRALINRDSTFLALIGAAQRQQLPQAECATCCNPLGAAYPLHQRGLHTEYAAAVTLCGLHGKLDDDAEDERGPRQWLAAGARHCLQTPLGRALGLLHATGFPVREVRELMMGQAESERPGSTLDDAARATSTAYGHIVAHTAHIAQLEEPQRAVPAEHAGLLRRIGEQLGFLIYTKDAWDDWQRDVARARFNPLSHLPTLGARRDYLLPRLREAAAIMREAFEALTLHHHQPLLRSVLVDGTQRRIETWMAAPGLPPPTIPEPPMVPPPGEPVEKDGGQGSRRGWGGSTPRRPLSERVAECCAGMADICCCRRRGAQSRTRDTVRRCCDQCDCSDCCDCCDCADVCRCCDGSDCPCDCGCDCS